jgi:tetratricopeptide (TPR) repeat protein
MKIIRTFAAFFLLVSASFAQTPPPQNPAPNAAQNSAAAAADTPQVKAAELLKQGRKLLNEGKLDDALSVYQKAIAIAPDYWDVHAAIGSALDLKGDYAEARQHLQKAIDLADADRKPSALRSMAMSYAFEGDAKNVDKFERRAYDLQRVAKPLDAAGTMNELGRVLLESGEIDKAAETYKIGFDLGVTNAASAADKDLWTFRWEHAQARIAARRGDRADAQKHVAAAKAIFDKKTLPEAQAIYVPYLTGYIAFYLGDYKTALADLQKADQKDAFILALLAQTEEKLGDKASAKDYWTKVLGIYSHNPNSAYARPLAKRALGMDGPQSKNQ